MATSLSTSKTDRLAIDGGIPACAAPPLPMYPGGNLIDAEEEQAVLEVIRSKRLFRYYGPQPGPSRVRQLEESFAAFMGVPYALAVTSGTAALITGLRALGIGPGDEVIVPAYTWIASASAVLAVGAVPVVAEVDASLTLDPADLENRLSPHTKAIMPVHMRGVPCRMDEMLAFARQHSLKVIEDTAQANGASYHGQRLGTLGDVGCFSLQFNKIITSGEGGMVITRDEALWKRALMFHDVIGGLRNDISADEVLWGVNFRMPELLAAVALVQLRRLNHLLDVMRAQKTVITEAVQPLLAEKGLALQAIPDPAGDASIALIFYAHDAPQAHRMTAALRAENAQAYVLYSPDEVDYHVYTHWTPIVHQRTWSAEGSPWQWASRPLDYSPAQCPRTLDILSRAVHLDVNPMLNAQQVEETIEALAKVIRHLG